MITTELHYNHETGDWMENNKYFICNEELQKYYQADIMKPLFISINRRPFKNSKRFYVSYRLSGILCCSQARLDAYYGYLFEMFQRFLMKCRTDNGPVYLGVRQ